MNVSSHYCFRLSKAPGRYICRHFLPFQLLHICIYDDGSTDKTPSIIAEYVLLFLDRNVKVSSMSGQESRGTFSCFFCCLSNLGVGYAKNRAVEMSSGRFICFCDADDYNAETRLQDQFDVALELGSQNVFIGRFLFTNFVGNDFRVMFYQRSAKFD